jgi:hypothetical protein
MAVTIGEVQVEVIPTPAPQNASAAPATKEEPKIALSAALARVQERSQRLRAD